MTTAVKPNWQPHPDATAKRDLDQSNRDCDLAVEVLRIARENAQTRNISAQDLVKEAEVLWKWVTGP